MIQFDANKPQNIILPSTNKALAQVLHDLPPEKFAQLTKTKDLASLVNSLFKESASNEIQNQKLLELLKNNPSLKELGSIKTTMKELFVALQKEKQAFPITQHLQTMLEDISKINDQALKAKLENSGILLESKLKNLNPKDAKIQEILSNDFKAAVLKTKTELENSVLGNKTHLLNMVDKLSLQIDYFQLSSHLANASAFYLPYEFDTLENGTLQIKKGQNETFFCDIDLTLKEYGKLQLRLGLFDKKYLNINISTPNEKLKSILLSGIKELKEQINSTGLLLKDIRFLEKQQTTYSEQLPDIDLGFEVKV